MEYQVNFVKSETPPYKDLYAAYMPELLHKQNDSEGFIHGLKCINAFYHAHGDSKPSAYINVSTGMYGCSVCGAYSAYSFLTKIIGADNKEASTALSDYRTTVSSFPEYDGFSKISSPAPKGLEDYVKHAQKSINPDLDIVLEYTATHGLDYQTLIDYGVGYIGKAEYQPVECLVFPYYINGKVGAVRGRSFDGRKGGIANSRFMLYGLDMINDATTAIICEGESDTLRMYQAVKDAKLAKVCVIGTPTASFRMEWLRDLSGIEKVYVIPQADEPSHKMANQIKKIMSSTCIILNLPFKRGQAGKDICDYLLSDNADSLLNQISPYVADTGVIMHKDMLLEADNETNWLIDNLIAAGDKVIIGGEQKSMKTFFTMFLAKAAATGTYFMDNLAWNVRKPLKILFVEEEGAKNSLAKRTKNVIGELPNDNIYWMYRQSVKLDNVSSFNRLYEKIAELKPDLIILDPLQRLHNQNEDKASEMAVVWDSIQKIVVNFPTAAVIIIAHFRKGGANENSWNSIRGSNRNAGEADLGIFISKDKTKHLTGETILHVHIDGREVGLEQTNFIALVDTKEWTMKLGDMMVAAETTKDSSNSVKKILAVLTNTPKDVKQILSEVTLSIVTIRKNVNEMYEKGMIDRAKIQDVDKITWKYGYFIKTTE